jgi:exonuclease SbcC
MMEIRALELENVKSYARETVTFARGTNAICGPNGAGKSTILEALGYALFDLPPARPIANWVREGEKIASVCVTVAADDEREYQVVRKCGSHNQYYVYDPEIGQRLADGSTDVLSWLREQFGVEESADLSVLFRDAVGVPQGLLTAAFLDKPSNRKSTFDPLLRVEEYNRAFGRLLDSRRALEGQVQALEIQIAGFQAEVKELPRLESQAASLAQEIESVEARLADLAPRLAALEELKKALEAKRDRLRELSESAARLEERSSALAGRVDQARQAVEQAQAAERIARGNQAGHRAYEAAQERLQALEAQEKARAELQRVADDCSTRRQMKEDRIGRLERDLQEASAAAAEAERLRPAAEEQERLRRELAQAQARAQQWQAAAARLDQAQRRLEQLEERLERVRAGLQERQHIAAEQEEQERLLESVGKELESLRAGEASEKALLEQLRSQEQALGEVEGARCPVCESHLTAQRRAELLQRNREQVRLREGRVAEVEGQVAGLAAKGKAAATSLQALQQRLSQLPRPAEYEALKADCERQQAAVRQAGAEAAELAEARARAESLEAQLAGIDDPHAAYQRALAIAGQAPELEKDLAGERAEVSELAARLAEVTPQLEAFARLDEQLDAARAELRANERAYKLYLGNEAEAGRLPERLAQLQKLQAELAGVQEGQRALADELEAARAGYRPEEHERVSAEHLAASEERSRLETQAQMQRSSLEEAQARIAELQEITARLQTAEDDLESWRQLGHTLDFLRRTLKEAGPQVTRALVEIISLQAARLYADITNDQTGRLRWSEDYEVLVDHKGYERNFQQLSGGEQMAAALAVRLALLREVSAIDVVFFDEPTSNLDDTRRDNLADQILGIKYFTQLFVVSHDDTFERATDHTVRIAKEGGESRVVV